MDPAENKPYIRETIEEKPHTPFWKKLLLTVLFAVVFGLVAAIAFVFGKGLADRLITTEIETAESVIFPPDDPEPAKATTPEVTVPETEAEASTEETAEAPVSDPSVSTEDMRAVFESLLADQEFGIDDVQQLYRAADALVAEAAPSLVSVSITRKGADPFGTEYSYEEQSFGVIVASTSKDILILTPYVESGVADGAVTVRFSTQSVADAYTKSTDKISGLTMLAVSVRGLDDATREAVRVIELGNSYNCSAGQPVIALGAPAGSNGSLCYGMLTHVVRDVAVIDNTVRTLHTDMTAREGSRGFLIDLSGAMVGWFDESTAENGCITAIGISKTIHPNMMTGIKVNGAVVPAKVIGRILSFFFLCAITLFAGAVILSLSGQPFSTSVVMTLACLTNVGIMPGLCDTSTFLKLPDVMKLFCALIFVVGRMEIFAFLIFASSIKFRREKTHWS